MTLALHSLGPEQSIYVNGQAVAQSVRDSAEHEFNLTADLLHSGKNVITVVATPRQGVRGNRGGQRGNQGSPGLIRVATAPENWKRSLFSGLAQVIVQSTGQPGEITLTAKSQGVTDGVLKIEAQPAPVRPAVAAN